MNQDLLQTGFLVVALVLATIAMWHYRRSRQLTRQLESERFHAKNREEMITVRAEVAETTITDLSRDLHDEVGQLLTFAILQMENMSSGQAPDREAMMGEVKKSVRDALDSIRSISRGLNADFIKKQGLVASLRQLAERASARTGIKVHLVVNPDFCLPDPSFAVIIFRIMRECLTNALKHGQATRLTMSLVSSEKGVEVSFSDNGKGMNGKIENASLGWRNMQHYASLIHGTLSVNENIHHGSEILLAIPKNNTKKIS